MIAQVYHFIRMVWQIGGFSNLLNEPIADEKTTIPNLPALVVHCDQEGCIFN